MADYGTAVEAALADHPGYGEEVDEERTTKHSVYWRFRCTGCKELLPAHMSADKAFRAHQMAALHEVVKSARAEAFEEGVRQMSRALQGGPEPKNPWKAD